MERYDYLEAVKADVKVWILDTYTKEELAELMNSTYDLDSDLYDKCFIADSVTGNASGSYTFSAWQAEENLCHNLDLLKDALEEFGSDLSIMDNAEACDVTIRCYLLGQAITEVLDELGNELE